MTETTNYRLKKPAPEDFYDIGDQNANMDAIDAALKDHNDALERKAELGENGIVPEAQLPAFSKLTLGETADTAYRGDRGKLAYDHSTDGGKHVAQEERAAWNAKETPAGAQAKADAAGQAARRELDGKAEQEEGRLPVSQLPDPGGDGTPGLPGRPGQGRLRPHFRRREARDGFGAHGLEREAGRR